MQTRTANEGLATLARKPARKYLPGNRGGSHGYADVWIRHYVEENGAQDSGYLLNNNTGMALSPAYTMAFWLNWAASLSPVVAPMPGTQKLSSGGH